MLWTEKYSPKSFDDVLGNVKIKEAIMEWAEEWIEGKHPEMYADYRSTWHW